MTYKQFNKIMLELRSLKKDEEALNIVFKKLSPDFNYILFTRHETLLIETLENAMEDKCKWISYFLCEMGEKFSKKNVGNRKDKSKIYIRNYKELYNLIKEDI